MDDDDDMDAMLYGDGEYAHAAAATISASVLFCSV